MNRPGITESRLVLNFQGAPFYTFLQVNAKLGWLNYVSVVFFFASYWWAEFETFLQAPALASYWLEDFADGTPTKGKFIDKTSVTLREAPASAASQSSLIKDQL
jgi:hypothetical protein